MWEEGEEIVLAGGRIALGWETIHLQDFKWFPSYEPGNTTGTSTLIINNSLYQKQ